MAERRKPRVLGAHLLGLALLSFLVVACLPVSASPVTPHPATQIVPHSPGVPVPAPTGEMRSVQPTWAATAAAPPVEAESMPVTHSVVSETPQPLLDSGDPLAAPRSFAPLDDALPTPPLPLPEPVQPLEKPDRVLNILLLGNDVPWAQGGRTDTIILFSLNRETGTAKLLSIPRDLYVVIPGWQMNRINLALPHGHGTGYPGGGGALVKDTILYNLGIPVDNYVRIGFSGFKEIIDRLGGVEIVVNCPVQDWRLREPDLDPEVEENWEPYLLTPGVKQMDGELALWYVRSRHNSNDIDRGRRQQKIVRAFLQKATAAEIVPRLPQFWQQYAQMFETDLQLADLLQLAATLPQINEINHHLLGGAALRSWTVPLTGEAVQLLNREAAAPLLHQFSQESTLHGAARAPLRVEVETHDPIMYRQAAENLIWLGFEPVLKYREDFNPSQTTITFHGSSTKGAFASQLAALFRIDSDDIVLSKKHGAEVAYHVDLGKSYNPCLPFLEIAGQDYPSPEPHYALGEDKSHIPSARPEK